MAAEDIFRRIQQLKTTVASKQAEKQRLLGRREELAKALKELIGTDDLATARATLLKHKEEVTALRTQITAELDKLEATHGI